jgi:hypothetical protein
VSVEAAEGGFFHGGRLSDLVRDVLAREPQLPIKVVASGHSVDVVAQDTSKVRVLEHLANLNEGVVLAVGDQGDIGGNDFELLAATPWSISVGRCSTDPTRCWCVDPAARRGPDALEAMLRTIAPGRDGRLRLDVRKIRTRARSRA